MGSPYSIYAKVTYFLTDILIVNLSYVISFYFISSYYHPLTWTPYYVTSLAVFNLVWLFSSTVMRLYFESTIAKIENIFRSTYRAILLHFITWMFFLFFSKSNILQSFYLTTFLMLSVLFFFSRFIAMYFSELMMKRVKKGKKIAILGYNSTAQKLANYFDKQKGGYIFQGFFDDDLSKAGLTSYDFIGKIEHCIHYAQQNHVEEIYSTILPSQNKTVEKLVQVADQNCIRIKFVPDFSKQLNERFYISFVEEFPIITLRNEPLDDIQNRFKKRLLDVVFSSLVIILLLSWLIPIIAILIKLESRGPVFFKQKRSGRDNAPFWCFKFRSMFVNDQSDHLQAIKNDPRVTRIGAFLRKTSLDEMPQFFNVLMGDMSLVGPRPHMLAHTEQYSAVINKFMVRHLLKPGITGWAQVNGYRGETENPELMQKRVEHDLWYLENWSLMLDIRIILMTVVNIFRKETRAY